MQGDTKLIIMFVAVTFVVNALTNIIGAVGCCICMLFGMLAADIQNDRETKVNHDTP